MSHLVPTNHQKIYIEQHWNHSAHSKCLQYTDIPEHNFAKLKPLNKFIVDFRIGGTIAFFRSSPKIHLVPISDKIHQFWTICSSNLNVRKLHVWLDHIHTKPTICTASIIKTNIYQNWISYGRFLQS